MATETIRARAALLEPVTLRSLDALHLATALEIADELDGVVSYDARTSAVAETFGLVVLAPKCAFLEAEGRQSARNA